MFAAQEGHLGVCKVLLQNGARVNLQRCDGATALSFAIQNEHEMV